MKDIDEGFSHSHNRYYRSLHNDVHFNSFATAPDQHVDDKSGHAKNKKSSAHKQRPPGVTGDRGKDQLLRHDAFLTANHLWPGKPQEKPPNAPQSQNLQLDGRIHDWVMRKNNTNADALVRTARQEYYNSINKHDSYY
jgi:hypothetical protein